MAVFYDTGDGDIYGGESREAVLEAMQRDSDDIDLDSVVEVPGTHQIHESDENLESTGRLITLEQEYSPSMGAYCVASNN